MGVINSNSVLNIHVSKCDILGPNANLSDIKDARSVSLYPYNRSQILQYVKYTK